MGTTHACNAQARLCREALESFASANMRTMHIIMARQKDFLDLLSLIRCKNIDRSKLDALVRQVSDFDSKLTHTKFFLSFFCNCGVRINVDNLNRTVKTHLAYTRLNGHVNLPANRRNPARVLVAVREPDQRFIPQALD
eukprot:1319614-Amorphochlora_amoeboformis.AAC.2